MRGYRWFLLGCLFSGLLGCAETPVMMDAPVTPVAVDAAQVDIAAVPDTAVLLPPLAASPLRPMASERPALPPSRQSSPTFSEKCGGKRYCTQMTSCAEAQFYLKQCGLRKLDKDGDGVPCESLCR